MRWTLALLGLCLVLGGCGSSDGDGDGGVGSGEPAAARDRSVQVAKGATTTTSAADRVVAEAERAQAAADAERARVAAERRRDRSAARRAGAAARRAQARAAAPPASDGGAPSGASSGSGAVVLGGTYTRLNGVRDDLAKYRGRVVLVVNTATECGFTPQFEGLEALYRKRRDEGLVVLGFPANDFNQESRSDGEIAEFCKANYGVTFPMFSRTVVKGGGANPLFAALTKAAGAPEWNFNKYLLDRSGRVVARFGSGTEPEGPELKERLDAVL